jgi:glucan-binding YG repeat protein
MARSLKKVILMAICVLLVLSLNAGNVLPLKYAHQLILTASAATNGWVETSPGVWYYYVNGVKKTGWFEDLSKGLGTWFYLDPNNGGRMVTGWVQISGKWYYFATDGHMLTGWLQLSPDKWYYLADDGHMITGWLELGPSTWYYFASDGSMSTGWIEPTSGKWYYLRKSGSQIGVMMTGFNEIERYFYYLDATSGLMFKGTRTIDGQSCTFDSTSGKLNKTGWITFYGYTYYAWSDYHLAKGTATISGDTYHFNDSCRMVKGWYKIDSNWYYFNTSTGARRDFTATVNSYYDKGFDVRFGNSSSRIQGYLSVMKNTFKTLFNLNITTSTPTLFTSTADSCKTKRGLSINSTTIDQLCPGGTNHSPLCTDSGYLSSDFGSKYPGDNKKTSIIWTGNALDTVRSFAVLYGQVVMLELSVDYQAQESLLLHEIAHQFDAPDHYHDTDTPDGKCKNIKYCSQCAPMSTRRPQYCIMAGSGSILLPTEETYCTGCTNDIRSHLINHH